MSKPVVTVEADSSMLEAINLIKQQRIRMLPVLQAGKLVGVVTDRDLKRSSASDASSLEVHEMLYLISRLTVKEIMTPRVITVPSDYTIEETAEILLRNKISGVPVLDAAGQLVGVITQTDIFRAIIALTGIGKKGVQVAVRLEDRPGSIQEAADIIRDHGGRLVSILSSYDRVPEGYRNVYIRFYGTDPSNLEPLHQALGERCVLLYTVDHRNNWRQIYAPEP
jgi:acetoin utilization protein AcuB